MNRERDQLEEMTKERDQGREMREERKERDQEENEEGAYEAKWRKAETEATESMLGESGKLQKKHRCRERGQKKGKKQETYRKNLKRAARTLVETEEEKVGWRERRYALLYRYYTTKRRKKKRKWKTKKN